MGQSSEEKHVEWSMVFEFLGSYSDVDEIMTCREFEQRGPKHFSCSSFWVPCIGMPWFTWGRSKDPLEPRRHCTKNWWSSIARICHVAETNDRKHGLLSQKLKFQTHTHAPSCLEPSASVFVTSTGCAQEVECCPRARLLHEPRDIFHLLVMERRHAFSYSWQKDSGSGNK